MKTAGQYFLEWYNYYVKNNGCSPSDYDVNFYWNGGNLEKEKEQIIEAATHGANFDKSPFKNAQDYYDSNFGDKVEEAGI